MDIDLRLPSEEHENDIEDNEIVTMLDGEGKPLSVDECGESMGDLDGNLHVEENGEDVNSSLQMTDFRDMTVLEPLPGMEFGSHGNAYAFYQEYARSVGFNTAIQNSRRSKTSREFIDAKFACSRYGTKREYEKSANRPRSRQGSKQDVENATGRRACSKTDCKASMHVKRRADGKWIIHRFEKEHNHELLPAQAVSEQTRLMYADMARQFAEYKTAFGHKNDSKCTFDKGRSTSTDPVDAHFLLEFFSNMQSLNSNFFYAIDVDGDQRLKNVLWIDAKSRHDYTNFSDIVSFDTFYVRNKYKMPLAVFIGVNQHYQFMLLGCALLSDESPATYLWVLQTWFKAMGHQAPKAIIADQDQSMKSAVSEVFPSTLHIFCLNQIMAKVSEALAHTIKHNENFMRKLEKCIYRSWTEDEFERRWHKFLERFDVKGNALLQSLHEDREKWVPAFMRGILLAGMAACPRSESVNCFFDKYVHKKTTLLDFIKQYETIMMDRYEEEAKASSDTWNKQPVLKSPSPFEKHLAGVYTQAVFRKFQIEVLGAVACIPKQKENINGTIKFEVQDFEKNQDFMVTFNEQKSEVSCMCHLFELKGFLCRHTMIVLQICGISIIPSQYILKRWTRDAKSRFSLGEVTEPVPSRMQRYNDLCQRAIKLCEEGSLSQESYTLTLRALDDASDNCFNFNNSSKNPLEAGPIPSSGMLCIEDTIQIGSSSKTNKKKNQTKKRKVDLEPTDAVNATLGAQESMQQMDKMSSRPVNFDGYFGSQQAVPGMVQLNLMAPTRESYYGNQQTMQGLGQLNSIAPTHEAYYGPPPTSMHALGQMDFFRTPNFGYNIRQEEPNGRSTQLHDEATRHV